jgi:prepilin-type N-terminal cleavage/methylation domain-containing protein
MNRILRRAGGFTLLEVVVAMAIVGLGVVTLLEIFSSGLRLGARSSVETESMAYGRQVMDEALARPALESGPLQGTVQDRARWQLRVESVREPQRLLALDSPWELKEITVTVRLADTGREVALKTFKLVHRGDS